MQDVAGASKLLGRGDSGAGDPPLCEGAFTCKKIIRRKLVDPIYIFGDGSIISDEQMVPDQQFLIAHSHQQKGQLSDAESECLRILRVAPRHMPTLRLLGLIAIQTTRFRYAIEILTKAREINDVDPFLYNDLGYAFSCLKQFDQALANYEKAISLNPTYPISFLNRGNALLGLRRFDEALASFDLALGLNSRDVIAHNNRGIALQNLNRLEEAVRSYDAAIALNPAYGAAYSNRGSALKKLRRLESALANYDKALALDGNHAEAHGNRAVILQDLGRIEEAIASLNKAIALKPDLDFLRGDRLQCKMIACEWDNLNGELAEISQGIERNERASRVFPLLAISDSASLQKKAAKIESSLTPSIRDKQTFRPSLGEKIRLGYFSADFRDHPIAFLMAGVFEQHDRSRFELNAFSFREPSGKIQKRLTSAFDNFIDVRSLSDEQVASLARQMRIDIAIDLTALTRGNRASIFGFGAAPVQVNYPYPGTMGAEYIDYLIADKILIPPETRQHYSERIVYLPDSYQANDDRRPISAREFSRNELDLPENSIVFCCFSNTYKITPEVFGVWMNILRRVDRSVLWLIRGTSVAVANLRREAERHGISGDRIIFAKRIPVDEHLARHRAADIFLDTSPYNAHMTASDALWAGLPVVTCMGESFASRVAGSILHAVGLPELVVSDWRAYEDLAVELAGNQGRLIDLKARLSENRHSWPLFDTKRITRHLEKAYLQMYERWTQGQPPADLIIDAD